jgi:hypothetical protein
MGDDADERAGLFNVMLEQNALLTKIAPFVERLSIDNAANTRALYDLMPLVEGRLDHHVSEQRVHRADIDDKIDKFLAAAAEDRRALVSNVESAMKTFVEHVIAIRTAAALAADNAGDAKNAALATREDTGRHRLADVEHRGERGQRGVAGSVVHGLGVWSKMSARSQVLLVILAVVVALAFGTQLGAWFQGRMAP